MKKYRVWHGVKGWIKYLEIVEATTGKEAVEKVKEMYKQHNVSKAWLVSK